MAKITVDKFSVPEFIGKLVVFIEKTLVKEKKIESVRKKQYKKIKLSWAKKYLIKVHYSIIT